jgi:ABC-type antimicrobial peptide transport system permease subunit
VAIVNESMALTYWHTRDVVGRLLRLLPARGGIEDYAIVGVVSDSKQRSLLDTPEPLFYVPLDQRYLGEATVLVRAPRVDEVREAMSRELAKLDPQLAFIDVHTLDEEISLSLTQERLLTSASAVSGCVAFLVALVGIYGLTSQIVTARTREIGIRLALGATRSDAVREVLAPGAALTVAGATGGLVAAIIASRMLTHTFRQIADPALSIGAAASILLLAAVCAALVPALRAARVAPAITLRTE